MTPASAQAAAARIKPEALSTYPDTIDVRSPAEFADDHVPGAINCPVLSDDERARVGTLHAQVSQFEARKLGAALISRNIAAIIERFHGRAREWTPAIYCWRGGQRSRSLAHVMTEIGWRAVQLEGGYRAYRTFVLERLDSVPRPFRYRVICGVTGSGKSRLLQALDAAGAQVVDLEAMARHRGSLLGDIPDDPQPSQKYFESLVLARLRELDPGRPVYVESESRKIGRVQVPSVLLDAMRTSPCIRVNLALEQRVALLREEYAHFLTDTTLLARRLSALIPLHGKATIDRWNALAAAGEFDALVHALLVEHYDPAYAKAIERNFPHYGEALVVSPDTIASEAFLDAAHALIAQT